MLLMLLFRALVGETKACCEHGTVVSSIKARAAVRSVEVVGAKKKRAPDVRRTIFGMSKATSHGLQYSTY